MKQIQVAGRRLGQCREHVEYFSIKAKRMSDGSEGVNGLQGRPSLNLVELAPRGLIVELSRSRPDEADKQSTIFHLDSYSGYMH